MTSDRQVAPCFCYE